MVSLARRVTNSVLAVALLLGAACRTAAPTAAPARLPDPLAPPVAGAALTARQAKAARSAAAAAERGDVERVNRHLAAIPAGHPVRELIALTARVARGEAAADPIVALATVRESWPAAWALATVALRREGRDDEALAAARRVRDLRRDPRSERDVAAIESDVVARALAEASELLRAGDAAAALARAHRLLELVPEAGEARVLAVRAALASGQTSRAAALLPALPDTPAANELKGRVAEALGQWELAAGFYAALPEGYPGRCELYAGAREQQRRSLAPPHLAQALAERALTRRGLAAILAWEVPRLAELAAGPVPVFEDVVGLPEGRDIVVAVRAGVLAGDSIARRFGPRRPVGERELLACLGRLAERLGAAPPRWCGDGGPAEECLARPATLDGETAAELVRSVAGGEGGPCIPR